MIRLRIAVTASVLSFLACVSPSHAARSAGSAALIIGKLPVGTRAIGLSGAYTAVADEPAAIYWNPAGLAAVDRTRVEGLHIEQGQEIRMENIMFAQPTMLGGTLAAAGSFLGQPPLTQAREDAAGNFIGVGGTFPVYQYKAAVGYGQDLGSLAPVSVLGALWSRGSVGGCVTVLGEDVAGTRSFSASVDAGYMYKDANEGRSFGVVVRQLGVPARGRSLPLTGQVGVAQELSDSLLVTMDLLTAADDAFRIRAGAEWIFRTSTGGITLRCGGQQSLSSVLAAHFSAGLGYRFRMPGSIEFVLEYAFVPVNDFEDMHAVSVQVGL